MYDAVHGEHAEHAEHDEHAKNAEHLRSDVIGLARFNCVGVE